MSFRRVLLTSLCLGGSMIMATVADATTTTFVDTTFNGYAIGFFGATGAAALTVTQTNNGNPGSALTATISDPIGSNVGAAIIKSAFSYDPQTLGAINSISASVDKNFTVTGPALVFNNTFRPVIEQNGEFYTAVVFGPPLTIPSDGATATSGFNLFTVSNLTAADFNQFDTLTGAVGTAHPDFSGSTILFGLGQVVTVPAPDAGDAFTLTSTFDNLSIGVSSVPEPTTWALFIGGMGMVGWSLRRQQSRRINYAFA